MLWPERRSNTFSDWGLFALDGGAEWKKKKLQTIMWHDIFVVLHLEITTMALPSHLISSLSVETTFRLKPSFTSLPLSKMSVVRLKTFYIYRKVQSAEGRKSHCNGRRQTRTEIFLISEISVQPQQFLASFLRFALNWKKIHRLKIAKSKSHFIVFKVHTKVLR